jgi:hypothetical protein
MGEPPTTAGTNLHSLLLMRGSEIPMGGSRRLLQVEVCGVLSGGGYQICVCPSPPKEVKKSFPAKI